LRWTVGAGTLLPFILPLADDNICCRSVSLSGSVETGDIRKILFHLFLPWPFFLLSLPFSLSLHLSPLLFLLHLTQGRDLHRFLGFRYLDVFYCWLYVPCYRASVFYCVFLYRLSWRRGSMVRTSVFGWRIPWSDLWLTCDNFVGNVSTVDQPTMPTRPYIALGSVNE